MTTTQSITAPALNDDAVLTILAYAGHDGAMHELELQLARNVNRWAVVLDELVQRGLIEAEDGEYFPTVAAVEAAVEAETDKLRALAVARAAR